MNGRLDRLGLSPSLSADGPWLLDAFQRWAIQTPDRPFLSDSTRTWTWAEFDEHTARLAGALRAAGVRYGDRVVLYHDSKLAHVAGYFAVMRLGAIAVHVYPERPWSFVVFAADHTDARLIFTHREALDVELPCPLYRFDGELSSPPLRELRRHPVAYLMFTSGTTAVPKAVVTSHENLLAVTQNLIQAAQMSAGDRELIFMPLGSTGGAGHLHAVTLLGNHAQVLPWFMADIGDAELGALCDIIERDRIDGMMATPGLITRLLRDHRVAWGRAGRRLRYLLANVTPMRQEVIVDLLALLPALRFVTYYGLTEASRSLINVCRERPGLEHSTGAPPEGVEIRLIRPDPATGIGEIAIRGPNVVSGYWGGEPAVDAERWLHTGDWGRRDPDSGLYFALGRIKDTINVDGLKCRPSEIEAVIRAHPAVAACAVVALPDRTSHHRIGAAVVLAEGVRPEVALPALRGACAAQLAHYKVPQEIRVLPALPRSDLGKIKRRALIELLSGEAV